MKEEEIQQALVRLEKLHQSGHLSRTMYIEKRQELLAQWENNAATTGSISRSDALVVPGILAPPLGLFPEEPFAPSSGRLTTRHLQMTESPMRLSTDGIENLVDRQTAAEIRALRAKPREPVPSDHEALQVIEPRSERQPPGPSNGELPKSPLSQHGPPHPPPIGQHPQAGPMPPRPQETEESPLNIGDILRDRYQLLSLLGTGGMGKVFLVEDLRFGGNYAAKVLHPWVVQHEPTIGRFIQEFKMMEQLVHPGIVRTFVLDEDLTTQSLFYLMEYVDGKTLQDVLERAIVTQDGPPFTGEETLHFLEKLSGILRYTHNKHVLHRDLKPTNIMLYQSNEGEYDLKLLDFGLAKWIHEKEDPSLHTGHAGTFFYIAPEQLMGGSAALVAADVFSLGVVLYQMLTGALPVAMAVPPSEVNPELPAGIDMVMRKAMHANWQQRHQSVDELLNEFRGAFDATPPSILRPTRASRPEPSGTHNSIRDLLDNASSRPGQSDDSPNESERKKGRGARSSKATASGQWSRHPSPGGRRNKPKKSAPASHPSRHPGVPSSGNGPHAPQVSNAERIARLRRSGRTDSPDKPQAPNRTRAARPTSTTIERIERARPSRTSTSSPSLSAAKAPSRLPKRKSTQERERFIAPLQSFRAHEQAGIAIVVSPDGKFLASAGADRNINLWDTSSWFKLHTIESKHQISAMLWSPRDDSIAFGTEAGALQIWKTLSAQRVQAFKHMSPVKALVWLPGGTHVLCGCEDASVSPWDIRTGKQERLIHTRHANIRSLAVDAGGFLLASASNAQPIKVWNLARHSLLLELSSQDNELLTTLCFSPSDTILASGCFSGALQIWEIQSGTVRYTAEQHDSAVTCVGFAPDGSWFVTGSEDQTVKRWDIASGRLLQTYRGHEHAVRSLCVAPDGEWLASFCEGGSIKVWEVTALP